jgi:hypothetical protein
MHYFCDGDCDGECVHYQRQPCPDACIIFVMVTVCIIRSNRTHLTIQIQCNGLEIQILPYQILLLVLSDGKNIVRVVNLCTVHCAHLSHIVTCYNIHVQSHIHL